MLNARGTFEAHALQAGQVRRSGAARLLTDSPVPGLAGTVRFDWAALDAWFEEDEQVFVHPRNPYVRVDALRSTRPVRPDLAWAYDFPTRQLQPIAGLDTP